MFLFVVLSYHVVFGDVNANKVGNLRERPHFYFEGLAEIYIRAGK